MTVRVGDGGEVTQWPQTATRKCRKFAPSNGETVLCTQEKMPPVKSPHPRSKAVPAYGMSAIAPDNLLPTLQTGEPVPIGGMSPRLRHWITAADLLTQQVVLYIIERPCKGCWGGGGAGRGVESQRKDACRSSSFVFIMTRAEGSNFRLVLHVGVMYIGMAVLEAFADQCSYQCLTGCWTFLFRSRVTFGMMSADQIRQQAHIAVVSKDLYLKDSSNKPLPHGVLDNRMVRLSSPPPDHIPLKLFGFIELVKSNFLLFGEGGLNVLSEYFLTLWNGENVHTKRNFPSCGCRAPAPINRAKPVAKIGRNALGITAT